MTRILARTLVLAAALLLLAALPAHATGAAFDQNAATDALLHSVPAAARAKSDAYFEGGYWLILWNALYAIVVSAVLLGSGVSARMRDLAFRVARLRWPSVALYGVFYILAVTLLSLPIDIYQGFLREHQYGLSNQDFAAWAGDTLIQLGVSVVSAAIGLPLIYAAIRAAPARWWLWGTGIVAMFLAVTIVLGPVFLEPMLNHFQPLPDGPLREQILSLARADGVPAHDVLEYDNSRQTDRISAHVSGLLGTMQISLNDNLIKQCTPDEVLAVMGHEMGHYVMGHIFNIVLSLSLIAAGGLAFSRWAQLALLRRFGATWRIHGQSDPAALPVLAACMTAYLFVMTPVLNTLTRAQEMQADIFGLNLVRKPDAFAAVALKLATYRKLDPSPWEEFVFFDHPSGRTRIATAMRWKAEQAK